MEPSKRVVARISRYRNVLERFRKYGAEFIFSDDLAEALSLTAAQVRKDFSIFSIHGRKKAGYRIEALIRMFDDLLDKNRIQRVIVAGAGPLGSALACETFLPNHGVHVSAHFGDEPRCPSKSECPTPLPYSQLFTFVRKNKIRHAILAVTDDSAQQALDLICMAGIRSVLSLSLNELSAPKDCVIHTVNLVSEFENLVFFSSRKSSSR